jgi:hypothetical protein
MLKAVRMFHVFSQQNTYFWNCGHTAGKRTWRPERIVCVVVGGGGAAAGAGAAVLLAGELKMKLPWSDSFNV